MDSRLRGGKGGCNFLRCAVTINALSASRNSDRKSGKI